MFSILPASCDEFVTSMCKLLEIENSLVAYAKSTTSHALFIVELRQATPLRLANKTRRSKVHFYGSYYAIRAAKPA